MTRHTHVAVALASGLLLARGGPLEAALIMGAVSVTAALLPDFDTRIGLKHRGVTHSLLAMAALAFIIWRAIPNLLFASCLGYGSHLLLDSLTIWGIPLLWPSTWRFRIATLRTGGVFDHLFSAVAFCVAIWVIFSIIKI